MSLKEKINEDMKSAMRSKDVALLGTIRLIQAAIKQKEVDERILVDDNTVISIIEKMLKQRNDSIEAFKKANRTDLVDKEEFEVSVLKNYMPEQMNVEEVEKIIQEVIKKIRELNDNDAVSGILVQLPPNKKYDLDTNLNGEERAFVVTGEMEDVFPMDIFPMQLLKECMSGNIEKMENLGIYEVAPEDFALLDYSSSSKIEAQKIIRDGLDLMISEVG